LFVSDRLPPNFESSEVRVGYRHRKPCTMCGKKHWIDGEIYFTDVR
jgi:hypothetical protein